MLQRQKRLPRLKDLLSRGKAQTESDRRAAIDQFRALHGLTTRRVRLVRRPVVH